MTTARVAVPGTPGPTGPAPAAPRRLPWDALQIALSASILTTVWRIQDLFPILGKIQAPTLAAVVALGAYVVTTDSRRKARGLRHPITRLVLAVFVWAVLSIPGGVYPGFSFKFVFNDYIKTLVMALLIAGSIRSIEDVDRYARVHVLGACVYSLFVFAFVHVGADGRLGELFYYDANGLALLLATTLPLIIYFLRPAAPTLWRAGAVCAAGIVVLTLMRSGSRGGFLALLGSGLFLLFGFRAIPARARFVSVAGVAVMLLFVGSDKYWQMMGTLLHPTSDYNWSGKDEAGRMEVWKRGMGYMMGAPILGVGASAFPIAEGTISPLAVRQSLGKGLKWSAAHNSFVQIGAELGIPGLLLLILILVNVFRTLAWVSGDARARDGPRARDAALAQALMASVIAYIIAGFFLSEAFSPFLYSVLGMVIGLAKLHPAPAKARARSSRAARRSVANFHTA